jgi:phage repressor protein C with HTH and peptisase S24 domain
MTWADAYIAQLQRGETVSFRPHGRSMEPRILDGQLVTVVPVSERAPVVGDAVLARVGGKVYLHLVGAVSQGRYRIENSRGHVNGWTTAVYGVVVKVAP